MRRRGSVALALIVIMMLSFYYPPVASAAGNINCSDPDFFNRWKGQRFENASQKHGASAVVPVFTLQQCTNPAFGEKSGSFYFSNVTPNNGGFNDIYQVGFGNCRASNCVSGQSVYTGIGRTESTPGCAGYASIFPAVYAHAIAISGSVDFKVRHASNRIEMWVGNTFTPIRTYPESTICWTQKRAEWFGETLDFGDQMGGTPSSHLRVTQTNYSNVEGGGFFYTSWNAANACNVNGAPTPPFRCDLISGTQVDVWTDNR